MKAPSFAASMAAAALLAGISFVAVGATRLDTQTSKDLLAKRGLPSQHHIVEEARRNDICVEDAGSGALRVTGPGGPAAAKARNPKVYEDVAASLDLINWNEIRC